VVKTPVQFVVRYAPAIRNYLAALIHDPNDAEEVLQEFLLRVSQHGFKRVSEDGGRFRHYLIVAVRNAAISYLQQQRKRAKHARALPFDLTASATDPDRCWAIEWRNCLLERAWQMLHHLQRGSPRSLCYTVLRARTDNPEADSAQLAVLVSQQAGRVLQPQACRKQLSRARRLFAQLLVNELALTVEEATPERIEEELVELELLEHVSRFLPPDWREQIGRGLSDLSE
jgi:RNA polymerase sigma-70 factor (ECF subfamily)